MLDFLSKKVKSEEWAVGVSKKVSSVFQWLNAITLFLLGCALSGEAIRVIGGILGFIDDTMSENEITQSVKVVQPIIICALFCFLVVCYIIEKLTSYYARKKEKCAIEEKKRLEKKVKKLEVKIEKFGFMFQGIGSLIKIYLSSVSASCKLSADERISFYFFDKNGRKAFLSDRNAQNPEYKVIHRDEYRTNEGIIGLARKKTSALVGDLPDYEKAENLYISFCIDKFKMTKETIKNLSMKARFYYAFRFSSVDKQDFNSMVVVESMNPKFATEESLNEIFVGDNDFIYQLVSSFNSYLPRLGTSKGKDF